ncbi:MAG TPA: hypothetical protein VGG33_26585 [Polyangia bacterium]
MLTVDDSSTLRRLAFRNQYNLIFLVGAAVFALALWSPWPLLIAAVAEFLWLTFGAKSDRFRAWSAAQEEKDRDARRGLEGATLARGLEGPYAARVQALRGLADQIRLFARERGIDPRLFAEPEDRFELLVASFVKMAMLHQRLTRFVAEASPASLEEEIVRLGQALGDEKDPAVRLSLRQALTVGQRRLKQHEQIESQRRALGVKMGTLEMSFDYLRSHVLSGNPPQELASELQELIASASFLTAAEAEANASLARLTATPVTRTVTTHAISE